MEKWKRWRKTNYYVSNKGRVYSSNFRGRILKHENYHGYKRVQLSVEGKAKHFLVHRLVAECFLKDYSENMQVNHLDANPSNNSSSNLEMVTFEEHHKKESSRRMRKMLANENYKKTRKKVGIIARKVHSNKVSAYTMDGEIIKTFNSQREGAKWSGVSPSCISCALRHKGQSTAGGYIWKKTQ